MSQTNRMSHLYNPANQTSQQLLDGFVIRKKEFKRIVNDLTTTDFDCSAQHFLIEGQRGTGKTSLLLRVKCEIEQNADFEHLLVVQFAEEQYNIFDLSRLWESAAEALEEVDGFEDISVQMDEHNEDDDYPQQCFGYIERQLVLHNKRLVLLVDNFGDILDKFSDIEQKRLRDIFHNSNHIQLIASSARSLEHTYKHDKPFFEFFKTIKLEGLNKKDVNTLMLRLADHNPENTENIRHIIETQPQRLETIRRLTGGIPRTIVLLFEIFADRSADVFEDLESILDRVTPLYKHRMDDLATQQQAIMDAIALSWDGIGSKDIVHALKKRGFNSKTVSAQLILLAKNGLVESINVDKKNKLYFIRERFFNIWYLMRFGRKKNKDQVKWLVRFLQQWCSGDELVNRAKQHIVCARAGTLNSQGGYYMAEALATIVPDEKVQHELLTETKNALRKDNPDIDSKLCKSDIEIFDLATKHYQEGNLKKAIKYYKMAIERGHVGAMRNLGWLYYFMNVHKVESLSLIKKSNSAINDIGSNLSLAITLLWHDRYQQSIEKIKETIVSEQFESVVDFMTEYFLLLLSKKQFHLALDLFNQFETLKDQLKPMYYALMILLKEEFPKASLKMGSELTDTVNEILVTIENKPQK